MIIEQSDIDINLLSNHFTTCGDYTKDVVLEELEYWRKNTDFLILVSYDGDKIDGFLIGYRNRNSLWISQTWRKDNSSIAENRKAIGMAVEWAQKHGLTSLTFETKRNEIKAMSRFGFREFSVFMKMEII